VETVFSLLRVVSPSFDMVCLGSRLPLVGRGRRVGVHKLRHNADIRIMPAWIGEGLAQGARPHLPSA
jgi:hypothetical protein